MGFLIDSDVLIDYERGQIDLESNISGHENEQFFISVITASELLHGVWRASEIGVKNRRSAFVEAVINRLPILPVDLTISRIHAQLWAELESAGQMIGLHDSWLAASCLGYGLTMVTSNIREFSRVPGLKYVSWLR